MNYLENSKSSTTRGTKVVLKIIILTKFVYKSKIKVYKIGGRFEMKIKDDFYIKEVAGLNVVVATGEAAEDMNAMINLNESAAFLWKQLENDTTKEELIKKLTEEYDVDYEKASISVDKFISKLNEIGCLCF